MNPKPSSLRLLSLELDPFVVNFGRRFGGPALMRAHTMMGPAMVAWLGDLGGFRVWGLGFRVWGLGPAMVAWLGFGGLGVWGFRV